MTCVVGARTSVQDGCVIHVGSWGPTLVGADCTIGHGAKFESCTIGDGCTVGMNAVILHGAVIGEESLVAAMSLVPEAMEVPARMLVAGVPVRIRRELSDAAAVWIRDSPQHYVELSREYLAEGIGRADTDAR